MIDSSPGKTRSALRAFLTDARMFIILIAIYVGIMSKLDRKYDVEEDAQ